MILLLITHDRISKLTTMIEQNHQTRIHGNDIKTESTKSNEGSVSIG